MSQKFCPVILTEEGELWTPSIIMGAEYRSFTKIFGLTNVIYRVIFNSPSRIAWIGEYSNIQATANQYKHIDQKLYNSFCNAIENIPENIACFNITPDSNDRIYLMKKSAFLVNIDKNEFVDLSKYITPTGLDPLPYLTCVLTPEMLGPAGEGTVYPLDGHWAFDRIELSLYPPEQGTEIKLSI